MPPNTIVYGSPKSGRIGSRSRLCQIPSLHVLRGPSRPLSADALSRDSSVWGIWSVSAFQPTSTLVQVWPVRIPVHAHPDIAYLGSHGSRGSCSRKWTSAASALTVRRVPLSWPSGRGAVERTRRNVPSDSGLNGSCGRQTMGSSLVPLVLDDKRPLSYPVCRG